MTVDVHALTGAYVLDSVPEHELRQFERHLTDCESCAQEVSELRETAARLGVAAAVDPSSSLRSAVLNRIHRARQGPKIVAARIFAAAAAALLVVATALGVLVVRHSQVLEDSQQDTMAMATILQADDARVARKDGATLVVSHDQDRMLLLSGALPPAPEGQDYQAWVVDDRYRSLGLITPNGHITADVGGAEHVAVTLEPDGGSPQPTSTAFLSITVP
jgi:anti-sigma-K factor RskA